MKKEAKMSAWLRLAVGLLIMTIYMLLLDNASKSSETAEDALEVLKHLKQQGMEIPAEPESHGGHECLVK